MRSDRNNEFADMILCLIYPERCAFCDRTLRRRDGGICPACRKKVRYAGETVCLKCGKRIADERQELCGDCRKISHYFDSGRSLLVYDDKVAGSIYRFKYGNRRRYARPLGLLMAEHFRDSVKKWGIDAIMPVPLHSDRLRRRGYNQAALLAREIGSVLMLPVMEDVLVRVRNTKPLKLLGARQRQDNLKNAFKIRRYDVKLKAVLLIDDIYTTGSTIDELSKVLKSAGVERVYFLTAAAGAGRSDT